MHFEQKRVREIHIQPNFIPVETVELGRLIVNPKDPQNEFHHWSDLKLPFTKIEKENFNAVINTAESATLHAKLVSMVGLSSERTTSRSHLLYTEKAQEFKLVDVQTCLKFISTQDETCSWIKAQDQKPVYLITAYHTVTNAQISEATRTTTTTEASGNLVSLVGLLSFFASSIGFGASRSSKNTTSASYIARGQRVYAISLYPLIRRKEKSSARKIIHSFKRTTIDRFRGEGDKEDQEEESEGDNGDEEDDYAAYTVGHDSSSAESEADDENDMEEVYFF